MPARSLESWLERCGGDLGAAFLREYNSLARQQAPF